MPTVFRLGGLRFFFFSREGLEPRHVHVEQAEHYAKFWLEPVRHAESRGFRGAELRELQSVIEKRQAELILAWDEHFSQ